jgi:parallel beta-helix repeat protein
MYYKKEWIVIIIVLALLPIFTLFSANLITGAAVTNSEVIDPFNETEEINTAIEMGMIEVPNQSISIGLIQDSSVGTEGIVEGQANCGGVTPCNCGDTLTESYTMSSDLTECTGDGLNIGAHHITLNCAGFIISGDHTAERSGVQGKEGSPYSENVTIKNCIITTFDIGIDDGGGRGVNWTAYNNTIYNISTTGINFGSTADLLNIWKGYNVSNNIVYNVSGRPLMINGDLGGSIVENNIFHSSNLYPQIKSLLFRNNTGYNMYSGVSSSDNSIIIDGTFYNNTDGIHLGSGDNATNNIVFNNTDDGIEPSSNVRVVNNTISFNIGHGINLGGSDDDGFYSGNTIFNNTQYGFTIWADRNLIQSNTIYNNTDNGIYLTGNHNRILYNTVTDNRAFAQIYYNNGATNNTFSHNILNYNLAGSAAGIRSKSSRNTLMNNTIKNFDYGIYLGQNQNDTTVVNNTVSNSLYAYYIDIAHHNTFKNNVLTNQTDAIRMIGSINNTFTNEILDNYTAYGIRENSQVIFENRYVNILFTNKGAAADEMYVYGNGSTILNSTFDRNDLEYQGNGFVDVAWYVDVYVNNTEGNDLLGVTVQAYNNTGQVETSATTNSNGFARLEVIEFRGSSASIDYMTNHTINISLLGQNDSTMINITATNSTIAYFTLNVSPVYCGEINTSVTLISNLASNGTCFYVNGNNLVINGANSVITGNGTGIGLNLTNFNNITINNITFNNFSIGILFANASNNTLYSSNINNHTTGISFTGGSTGNNLTTNYILDNSANGTVLIGSNNNYIYNNYFSNNTNYSYDDGTNFWNITLSCISNSSQNIISGDCLGGNFWEGYTLAIRGSDNDFNGIGDTAQTIIGGSNLDSLPLVGVATAVCGNINLSTYYTPGQNLNSPAGYCLTITNHNIEVDVNGLTITGQNGINVQNYTNVTIRDLIYSGVATAINANADNDNNIPMDGLTIDNMTASNGVSGGFVMYLYGVKNFIMTNSNISSGNGSAASFTIYNSTITDTTFTTYGGSPTSPTEAISISGPNNTFINGKIWGENVTQLSSNWDYADSSIYLINVTMKNRTNITTGANDYVYMQWYIDVNVTNTSKSPIQGVNVTGNNVLNTIDSSVFSANNGVARLTLTEFYSENNIRYITTNNHSILAYKGNYTTNSTELNLRWMNSTMINLTLKDVSCGTTIKNDFYLGEDISSEGNCFNISSQSVTIYGQGFSIVGNGSGYGLTLNGIDNTLINNLQIRNFSRGVYLYQSDNNNLTGLTIINNSYGLVLNESNNNIIRDLTSANNSLTNVTVTNPTGTTNYFYNSSLPIDAFNVNGTAQVFYGWYVYVNLDQSGTPLSGVTINGTFKNTGLLDYSAKTDINGTVRLELIELKKNSTGTYYLTPHNISVNIQGNLVNGFNSTVINLSQTNNTEVNLSLNMDCTTPGTWPSGRLITSNIIFCPGTYYEGGGPTFYSAMQVDSSNINITCDGTKFISKTTGDGRGVSVSYKKNVTISGCTFENYFYGIQMANVNNSIVTGNVFNNNAYYGIAIWGNVYDDVTSVNVTVSLNNFSGPSRNHIECNRCANSSFYNNTFTNAQRAVRITGTHSFLNTVYHNTFASSSIYHIDSSDNVAHNFNTTVNNTGTIYTQGNEFDDFCDKGTDDDGDGYADSGTSYPYSASTSTKFDGLGTDYGPKITTCVSEVQLESNGNSGFSSSETSTTTTEAIATPTQGIAKAAFVPVDFYEPEDAKKFLTVEKIKTEKVKEKITEITILLQNNGTKKMRLFPEILQEYDDPFFIVHKKTLGYKGSFASLLAQMYYSPNVITGRLLTAEILDTEEIILEPGEKLEKTLEIREGLILPRTMKIQFTSFDQVIKEETIELDVHMVTGVAIDLDRENNLIDIYAVIVPEEYLVGEVAEFGTGSVDYDFELNINKLDGESKHSVFSDLFGPYSLEKGKSFVFAQQLEYNDEVFSGDFILETQINGVHNEFEITLD